MRIDSIALIGYRGTGKTTVAQRLAVRLGWDWVDADVEIELRTGKSIVAIFADDGEPAFRDLEATVVADLCRRTETVIALGGGAVSREENQLVIKEGGGAVVWLQASVDSIERRIADDPATSARRPNLTNAPRRTEIERLLALRTPNYRACATLEVDTEGKAPAEIADEIVAALGLAS
ncbi:MAG: shikimate kinase [Pirellulales bacterium]|nr:shikimate kinase [Pirellulales bacterium]